MADYKKIVPFIKKWEGGMSNDKSDTASHRGTMPGTYKGQTGWHTNKGVTWQTFSSLGNKLGYSVTSDNFISMPDSIWGKIFKGGYWDAWGLDNSSSQMVADYIVEFAWGFGVGGSRKHLKNFLKNKHGITANTNKDILTELNILAKKDEKILFAELVQFKKDMFVSLDQPRFIKGWLNRTNEFATHEEKFVGGSLNKKKVMLYASIGLTIVIVGGVIWGIKTGKI